MTTPTAPNVNVENLDSHIDNPTDAATDLGNDLLERAQEAQSQQTALLESTALQSRYNDALADYVRRKSKDKSSAWKIASKISSSRK